MWPVQPVWTIGHTACMDHRPHSLYGPSATQPVWTIGHTACMDNSMYGPYSLYGPPATPASLSATDWPMWPVQAAWPQAFVLVIYAIRPWRLAAGVNKICTRGSQGLNRSSRARHMSKILYGPC
jgi:hypothetical protein